MTSLMLAAVLVSGGKPEATVFTDHGAKISQIAYAVQELTNWIGRITGAALPVDAAEDGSSVRIVLGTPGTSDAVAAFAAKHANDFAKLADNDGFVIAEEGGFLGFGRKTVMIAAHRTKGVLNGVYRFLENNSDIIWVRPYTGTNGCDTIYGKSPDFKNGISYLVDVPVLTEARFWSGGDHAWQARLLNKWFPATVGKDGKVPTTKYGDNAVLMHEFYLGIVNKYQESDPDIFPLIDGKRHFEIDHQLCFMNPKTAQLFAKECEPTVAKMPHNVKYFGIGLGDNWSVCQCDWCMKPIDLPGGGKLTVEDKNFRSTQYTIFANRLSDILQAKFPWMNPFFVGAYVFTAEAPAVPCRGGTWLYCPYVKNHKRPVFDDSINAGWHRRAEDFRKAGMGFRGLYEYYFCTTTPCFYHAVCDVAKADLNYYLPELRQCYLDAIGNDRPGDKTFDALSASAVEFWTMSRLMWNPSVDVKATRREFCRRAYREAGEIMYGYYDRLADNYNNDPAGCYWNDLPTAAAKHYIVEKGLAGWLRETLAKAEDAAVHPGSKELIRLHRATMEKWVAKAEKEPKRITLVVPQILAKPTMTDEAYWKDAAQLAPVTEIGKADKPVKDRADVRVAHDRETLYVRMTFRWPRYREELEKAIKAGPPKPDEQFVWNTPFEFYLDGDMAAKGSYHFFSAMYNGHRYTGIGPGRDPKDPPWTVEYALIDDGIRAFLAFPLSSVGVEISKGNKIGCMFVGPWCAWNGGQWHAPTAFQTLMLEMK